MLTRKPKPERWAFFGATGTGKTQGVLQAIAKLKPARLMVWDYKHDPGLSGLGTAYTQPGAFVRALKARRFCVRYLPDHEGDMQAQFALFCRAAWAAGDVLVFVDELAEVTKANRAPPAWKKLVNVSREYTHPDTGEVVGVGIIGASQRAAECDKSFIGNCDLWHVGRMGNEHDAKALGGFLRVPPDELLTMPDLHWIERRAGEVEPRRGVLSFGTKKPKKATTRKG